MNRNNLSILALTLLTVGGMGAAFISIIPSTPAAARDSTIVLSKNNTLSLDDEINPETVAKIMSDAQSMDSSTLSGPITLVLYTPGGDIQAGVEFINFLKGLKHKVNTYTMFAASMGFQTVQGLGERVVSPNGTLMAHKARGGFQGEFPGQLNNRLSYYTGRLSEMDKHTVSRTSGKLNLKQFQDMYENELWLEGADTVKYGLADRVANARCDTSLSGVKETSVTFLGFKLKVIMSACPLIKGIIDIVPEVETTRFGVMTLKEYLAKGGSLRGSSNGETVTGSEIPISVIQTLTVEQINKEIDNLKQAYKKKLEIKSTS